MVESVWQFLWRGQYDARTWVAIPAWSSPGTQTTLYSLGIEGGVTKEKGHSRGYGSVGSEHIN